MALCADFVSREELGEADCLVLRWFGSTVKASHPNFDLYSRRLSKGWIPGRFIVSAFLLHNRLIYVELIADPLFCRTPPTLNTQPSVPTSPPSSVSPSLSSPSDTSSSLPSPPPTPQPQPTPTLNAGSKSREPPSSPASLSSASASCTARPSSRSCSSSGRTSR